MIRIVTDSTSMLPPPLRERFGVGVVAMTVTVDGEEHREGNDLTTDDFYARLAAGATVATAAPAPGDFLDAYREATEAGADHVLSIHTGATYSAVMSAATIAAGLAEVEVTLVDTALVSFPVALCIWAAGEALVAGATPAQAADAARATAARTGSVFVVGVPALARQGGRFVTVTGDLAPTSILLLDGDGIRELAQADDLDIAVDLMARHALAMAADNALRVGVGDALRPELAVALVDRLTGAPGVAEVVRYEVGPSVGAHTGAGTVGIVYAPLE